MAIALTSRRREPRPVLHEQLAQDRAMALVLALAVAADREVRLVGQPCEELERALTRGLPHLAPVALRVAAPARGRERLRERPAHQLRARRQLRVPDVEEIAAGIVGLAHAPWEPAYRTQPQPLARRARSSQPDYADHRGSGSSRRLPNGSAT